jgi:hypothetical protein
VAPGTLSHSERWVEALQFDARIGGGEVPVSLCVLAVADFLPNGDFLCQVLLVGEERRTSMPRRESGRAGAPPMMAILAHASPRADGGPRRNGRLGIEAESSGFSEIARHDAAGSCAASA